MPWNPDVYDLFKAERDAPFDDVLSLIDVRSGLRALDLGCGTGELTARLAAHLPESSVLGVDSSASMIARAWARVQPGLRFERARIEDMSGKWDLVFSHAALQWLPDHERVFPHMLGLVAPGGQFAAVISSDHAIPARRLLREVAREAPFVQALGGWMRQVDVLPLERYAELFVAHGAQQMTLFEKLYPVLLPGVDALVTWYRGTALVPYLDRLPESLRDPFVARYRARLAEGWAQGPRLYPGKRMILWARFGEA